MSPQILPVPQRLLPVDFVKKLGYPPPLPWVEVSLSGAVTVRGIQPGTARRYLALWWERCGDELGWTDGVRGGAGQLDHRLWLTMMQRSGLDFRLREQAGINLGSSEEEPTHWMVVNVETGEAWIAPKALARRIVEQERLEVEE